MPDPRLTQLANILVNYSTKVKADDWVHITAGRPAVPLVRAVIAAVLAAGGRPTFQLTADELEEVFLNRASSAQRAWVSPAEMLVVREADVSIHIVAPDNTRALAGIPPAHQQERSAAFGEWMEISFARSASGDMRWVLTNYPCLALAQEANMSLADYEDFVHRATFADQPDPVANWQALAARQARLIDWLAGKKEVVIRGPHVDLTLSVAGRTFINSAGNQNMPSGEIFTSLVEDSANGWVRFSYPAIYLGREVTDVRFVFEKGRVVEATAAKNEAFLHTMLDTDAGARYLGELGLGTNFGIVDFTGDILYDEKIGGTFHLALGNSFPETGGQNKSDIHWDFICDARRETSIWVDGQLFFQDGQFQVEG